MVYCTKCGTLNPDTATACSNCGAPLSVENRPYTRYDRRRYYEEGYGYRRRGNGLGLLIAGLFILLLGLAALFRSLSVVLAVFLASRTNFNRCMAFTVGFKTQPRTQASTTLITYSLVQDSACLIARFYSLAHKRVILIRPER